MTTVEVNPPGMEAEYLQCLNECFHGWGGAREFDWGFNRKVGAPPADLIVIRHEGQPIAGSAVTYRQVRLANGRTVRAGIMTGSWTLPAARGQGCFSRIIEESQVLTARRAGALLLAFVTESNPSARRLAAAGSALFPTCYHVSPVGAMAPETVLNADVVKDVSAVEETLFRAMELSRTGAVRFAYTASEWASQFLYRPAEVQVLALGEVGWAVVEVVNDFERVQALIVPDEADLRDCLACLMARAIQHGRRLFAFSTSAAWHEPCAAVGLENLPGHLTALVADVGSLKETISTAAPWSGGDTVLADPHSPWFLGEWALQSGDRM